MGVCLWARRAHGAASVLVPRACVFDWMPLRPRRHMRARSVGVVRSLVRLAGVPPSDCLQRGHWRVEHRACHHDELGMRRLFGPGGAPPWGDALVWVVDAARAIVCAHACVGGHVCRYSCAYERGVISLYVCMYVCVYTDKYYISICVHYTCICRDMCTCVRDAAVAITGACGYVRRDI